MQKVCKGVSYEAFYKYIIRHSMRDSMGQSRVF